MRLLLGCIADDYTGASDLAGVLRGAGLRVVQSIGVPRSDLDLPEVDAVVVSLKSRSIAPERAVELSLEAEAWLRARGAAHVMFKICSTFDSTDRGNIGPVTDALRARAGGAPVIVNPAFPENNRSVYAGHLFVGLVPLHESPLKDHPLNPMRDSNLVRVLARQSKAPVGLIPFATVEQGADAVLQRLASIAAVDGAGAAIADAVAAPHLDALGEAALAGPLSTGASGLGAGIARSLVRRHALAPDQAAATEAPPLPGSRSAILAGSCSAATREQIARARDAGTPVRSLDVERILAGDAAAEVHDALAWSDGQHAGPFLIASSASPEDLEAARARFGGEASGHAVEQAFAALAEALVERGVGRLVVAGGETSGAVVDRLGIEGFVVGADIAPGVPVLRATGRRHAGLAAALKSGNFGGPDFFRESIRLLS